MSSLGHSRPCDKRYLINQHIGTLLQKRRHFDAERLRSLEVDDEFVTCRLLDRNVRWLRPPQDFAHGTSCEAKLFDIDWCISHEPTGIRITSVGVHRRQALGCRETDDVRPVCQQKTICNYEHRLRL